MAKKKQRKKRKASAKSPAPRQKDFLDMIAPAAVRFNTDYYIFGNTYRCTMALKGYPPTTEDLALLYRLSEMSGVNIRLTARKLADGEEDAIIQASSNKNRMELGATKMKQSVMAEATLEDVRGMLLKQRNDREALMYCSVFIELIAKSMEDLLALKSTVSSMLSRSRLLADPLFLCQLKGFQSANPAGMNVLGGFAERVLPTASIANLFPVSYSGKSDPHGFYIGHEKYGSNVFVDLDQKDDDKTSGSATILGNSGQGKTYLLQLLLCNVLEAGKKVICLDSEHELDDLCTNLGGTYLDLLSGQYRINLLEPRRWDDGTGEEDPEAPPAFRGTLLAQHTSFLRDIFRVYKGFDTAHIDTLEIMVGRLYQKWGISDDTDVSQLQPMDYPILSDLYELIEDAYQNYESYGPYQLYTPEILRGLLLGLHSMCKGADARFFNGHTNIQSARFLVFGVKALDDVAQNLRDTLLFTILSYMSGQLLSAGNSVATIDELYLWLNNPTAITYIRNSLKRVRKQKSHLILATQNLEDFDQPGIREMTRPLFAIPTHQFYFNAGVVDQQFYMRNLQLQPFEYGIIQEVKRGECLYRCGSDRHTLKVVVPEYKAKLFKRTDTGRDPPRKAQKEAVPA